MKESKTAYAYLIEHMQDPSFQKVWDNAFDFVRKLPSDLCDELHESLNRGVDVLDSEPLLQMYIYAFGKMHNAKLLHAFNHMQERFVRIDQIEIVDYGCGQGLASICYHDFIKEHNPRQRIKKVTLIEPSSLALSRAELLCSRFYPDAEIIAVNKSFDDLTVDDIAVSSEVPTLHLFSNILDVEFYNLNHLIQIVKNLPSIKNEYVIVSPIQNTTRTQRLKTFASNLGLYIYYENYLDKRQLDEERDWTCAVLLCSDITKKEIIAHECEKVFESPIRNMATWAKENLPRENGEIVPMQVPIIASASRSTDIPAFYADWFFHRLKVGYSAWTNPFNGVKGYVSYKNTRFIVFWSKNPRPLLSHLDYLRERNIGCYIQYTLNDYEQEGLERGVPKLDERIETFKDLVKKLGKGRVIWRFDPLMLTDDITIDTLLAKIENIGDQLQGYTEKLVFSYADIVTYRKVKANLEKSNIPYIEWTEPQMLEFAERLALLNKKWGYTLATCGEKINLQQFGIEHNHCIDDALIIRFAHEDKALMDFLKVKTFPIPAPNLFGESTPLPSDAIILPNNTYATHGDNRDKGQRQFCGCIVSKDIGEYNTCPHLCEYCYANASKRLALQNWKQHKDNPDCETILL